ncbi:MAG: hypothetical protein KTR31_32965 [Myxococcales bacterium]|nr:hypothetical protein [Myxococcales bacterium]
MRSPALVALFLATHSAAAEPPACADIQETARECGTVAWSAPDPSVVDCAQLALDEAEGHTNSTVGDAHGDACFEGCALVLSLTGHGAETHTHAELMDQVDDLIDLLFCQPE